MLLKQQLLYRKSITTIQMNQLSATVLANIRRNANMFNASWTNIEAPYHYCVCCGDLIPGVGTHEEDEKILAPECKNKRHHWKTFQHLVRRTYYDQFGNLNVDFDNEYNTPWSTDLVNACERAVERDWPVCLCNLNVFTASFLRDPSYFVLFISNRFMVPMYYQLDENGNDVDDATELDTDDDDHDEMECDYSSDSDTNTVVKTYQNVCPTEYEKQCNTTFTVSTRNNLSWHAIA